MPDESVSQLTRIERKLDQLLALNKENLMTLDDIIAKVNAETTVNQSAITLLGSLSAQIASLKNDPAKLQELANSIDQQSAALAAAVTANTPTP